jgi:hypothetical protein
MAKRISEVLKMTGELYQLGSKVAGWKADGKEKVPNLSVSGLDFFRSISSRGRFTGRARSGGSLSCGRDKNFLEVDFLFHG